MRQLHFSFALLALFSFVNATLTNDPSSDPYTCAADRPCKIGCCSKGGVCGLGPEFCAADKCQSSCDAKSECDPGWGSQWSTKETCPLNVCCSKYGFCGTTQEFCGDKKVNEPSCSGNSAGQRVIGYYEGWSTTRACKGLNPEDILSSLYTHLNFAFAFVDPQSFAVAPMQQSDVGLYQRFTNLKQVSPGLQTWISIGGWSMNDPDQPTAKTFSTLAGSQSAQQAFFKSLVNFLSTYGFDGVDIDWEYPVAPERSGNDVDFANYVSFLKNLRNALGSGGKKYGLSITLPSSYWYMRNFDIVALADVVDWFNVMTYDLHGTWDSTDPYIGSIVQSHTNLTEIDQTMDLMWRNQIDPGKVVMGTGFYGRSFTLSDPSCKTAGCAFSGGGNPGPCSVSAGTLMFSEITDIIAAGATVTLDKQAASQIVTWDNNQWVSYDDETTLKMKADYANSKCLGGLMVWAASTDDGSGTAIQALAGAIGRDSSNLKISDLASRSKSNIGQCVWGDCNAACPSGYSPATGSYGKVAGYAGIFNGCPSGVSRYYCCPTGSKAPVCTWRGSPKFCGLLSKNRCSDKEVEVSSTTVNPKDGTSCWTGHMSLCCEKDAADSDISDCTWKGSAPFCTTLGVLDNPTVFFTSYGCDSDEVEQTTGKYGAGGEQPCLYDGGFKSFCCKKPDPYANRNCKWHQGSAWSFSGWSQSWLAGGLLGNVVRNAAAPLLNSPCVGECPAGQVPIATDGTSCQPGTYSYYCCDNPNAPPLNSPGDVSLCPTPPNIPGYNSQAGPDGDTFDEASDFDLDCTVYSLSSSSSKLKARGIEEPTLQDYIDLQREEASNVTYSNGYGYFSADDYTDMEVRYPRSIEKRTLDKSGKLKFCAPGEPPRFDYPATYSGYRTIARLTGKGWITVAKPLICGAIGVAITATQPTGEEFVTEHVFEKQSLRNYIQLMMNGKLPGGGTLSKGAAAVKGVFDNSGSFFSSWPKNFAQGFGDRPWDTIFGALGHTNDGSAAANVDNLQVCDRALNAIKEHITSGKQLIDPTTFNGYGELQKVSFLSDVVDTFQYMQLKQTVTSYNSAYKAVINVFNAFAKTPGAQAGYDYSGAFKEIASADIDYQVATAKAYFQTLLTATTKVWNSAAVKAAYNAAVVKENQDALAAITANLNTYISLPKASMLA
ncbi:hypothetical protein AMS68_000091 [Peltaster fructicola]|uniref:chitinase n=1 Tax=Peltaster fructicola TaxID=286661 RepID=A0A6H0XIN5_9PEZI|nr:hypothetical protein AMS68_000091 [Peltaster fructicola]